MGAEINVGGMLALADTKCKNTRDDPPVIFVALIPARRGRSRLQSGHYQLTPVVREERCVTVGDSARPTLTSRDQGEKDGRSNDCGMRDPLSY